MKTSSLTTITVAILFGVAAYAQAPKSSIDSLANFNEKQWTDFYFLHHTSVNGLSEFIYAHQKDYVRSTYFPSQRTAGAPNTPQQACTNVDFETGNLNGWAASSGFNPLYNAAGCCQTAGGAQQITSGAGVDGCGGFPVVAPGGNFSVKLGDNATGGVADRLEQTFNVTSGNANFTYKYAVVFEDPGHTLAEQPSFQIDMVDSTGAPIPCTYYNVAAGQNIPGFINSTTCANVVYKPWTSVSVDLMNFIGQNVTIRFTTYDCSLGGHYAYAYIDGGCTNFNITQNTILCEGSTIQLTAPAGFATYNWTGPNNSTFTGQTITTGLAGNYVVNLTTVTGCAGPSLNYTLVDYPKPNAGFTVNQISTCNPAVAFVNTSNGGGGTITGNDWNFGNGNTATTQNASQNYLTTGTFNVQLITTTNMGCKDTAMIPVTVNPMPIAAFSANTVCLNGITSFTNASTVSTGTIASNWQFGDATTSIQTQPTHIYAGPGNYFVTLNVTTAAGCTSNITKIVSVSDKPNAQFIPSQSASCTNTITFTNASTIGVGNIAVNNWNFGDGNTAVSLNALNNYANTGSYTVQLITTSNMGCKDTAVVPISIYPSPVANFFTNNICSNAAATFTNASTISNGSINLYNWQYGDGTQSMLPQSSHQYVNAGTYNVTLTVVSNQNCSNTISKTITIYPMPTAMFTASNACVGTSVNYSNTSSVSSGTITNYVWDFNFDGIPDNTNQNVTNVFNTAGTYITQLMVISDHNCSANYNNTISVYPKPNAQFISSPVCEGTPTTFTNLSTVAGGQVTGYNWYFGDATGGNSNMNATHTYTSYGNYNVTLSVASNFNCTNSVTAMAIVNAKPNANFMSSITCHNQATQFNNQTTIANGSIVKYRWDFDNNGVVDDSTANPSHIYPNAGVLQSRMQAVSNGNCIDQVINPVVVHYNPIANFSVPSVCMPNTNVFTNLSSCADGIITSYAWDFNGDNLPDNLQANSQYNFAQVGNHGVKLEVQSEFGCVNTIMKSAYVNATPSSTFVAQNKTGCPELCTKFFNQSTIGNGTIATIQWIFGDNSMPDYTQSPTHCYSTGNYNVTLKVVSDSGCIASTTMPGFINVYPTPVANFMITPEEIDFVMPLVEVQDRSTGATQVNYLFSDGTVKNTPNFSHAFETTVAKTVSVLQIVTNEFGCKDSLVKEINIKPAYTIYIPNAFTPNSDGLNDGFQAVGVGIVEFKMQIFDRWGSLIFETNDINKSWDGNVNGKGNRLTTKDDVYVWKVKVKDANMNAHDLIGHVTIVK